MTPFRRELESVKTSYESARYPGDLAIDTLLAHRAVRRWPVALGGFAAGAIAASVGILLMLPAPASSVAQKTTPDAPVVAQTTNQTTTTTTTTTTSSTSKITMDDIGMTPRGYDMTPPAMPSFPTWSSLCTPADSGTETGKSSS